MNSVGRHHMVVFVLGWMVVIVLALAEVTATFMSDLPDRVSGEFNSGDAPTGSRSIGADASPRANPPAPYLVKVDEALAERDTARAERLWNEAYVAALRSRRWDSLIEVGEAALKIGEAAGEQSRFQGKARENYMVALFHARQKESVAGVLSVAEAFAKLGDRDVVDQSLRIAERLAAKSDGGGANDQVLAFRERLAARAREVERRN